MSYVCSKFEEDINPKYSKIYRRQWCKNKFADRASLWMDRPLIGLIRIDRGGPPLGPTSEEHPQLDFMYNWPKASCGTHEEGAILRCATREGLSKI